MNDRSGHQTAQAHFAAGQALHRQGRLAEAEQRYRAALACDEGHSDAMEWLGALCLQAGKLDEAIGWLEKAAALQPGDAAFQDNLAAALVRAQRLPEAVEAYRRSLAAAPDALVTRVRLGDLLRALGRQSEAQAFYSQAVAMDPHLKAVCRDTDRLPTSEAFCRTVLDNGRHILGRYPFYAQAHYSQALALLNLGQAEEARRAAERALMINPTIPAYYNVLIHTGDTERNAPAVSALEQLAEHEDVLPEDERIILHFLLAKAYDDLKRHDDAFAHLQKGNTLKRATVAYDEAQETGRMKAIAAVFTRERLAALRGGGCPSDVPVFVVGMPRSGTSLVEQILASHPAVYGAGELDLMSDLIKEGLAGTPFPEGGAGLGKDDWRRLGEAYVKKLSVMSQGVARVVDKQPLNFLHIGLLHLALPKARIIHVKRAPLDTCFSCYSLVFAGSVYFTYDFGELGRYYRAYEALMEHWRSVLPGGTMLEVQYEDLVNGTEAQARRLVEYCGLEWDARCLQFHKTERAVTTASVSQVRKPVYQGAVGRAQNYAAHLGPLRKALELP